MGHACLYCRQSGYRAEYGRDHRYDGEQVWWLGDNRDSARDIGTPDLLKGAYTAAGSIKEADVGQTPLCRHVLGVSGLVADSRVGSTTAYREVTAAQDYLTSIESAQTYDGIGRAE